MPLFPSLPHPARLGDLLAVFPTMLARSSCIWKASCTPAHLSPSPSAS
jgi:hypothetical protein